MEGMTDAPRRDFARTWETSDIAIRSDGSGRTVQAYITPFNTPQEIQDRDGHYNETIPKGAFERTLSTRNGNFAVLFNHGRTYDGRTSGSLMVPIGKPLEVKEHDRGLYSETEFLENPLADAVLDGIKKGAIRGYSFSGTFRRSEKMRPAARGQLPTITRSVVEMREYGPVLFPAYAEAVILGTRGQSFVDEIARLDPEDVERLRQMLGVATPLGDPATPDGTPNGPAVTPAANDPAEGHSTQQSPIQLRAQIVARNRTRRIA